MPNKSAFIKGRVTHDNFHTVQSTAKRLLHVQKRACVQLIVDIAKALDTVLVVSSCTYYHTTWDFHIVGPIGV
jgi:hypothetical protein